MSSSNLKKNIVLLALETSGAHMGVGLYAAAPSGIKRLALYFKPAGSTQSDILIATIGQLLKKCRLSKSDVQAIAVDVGPGSFTGVRVGVATARALGQGLKKPVIGVNSLEAIAHARMDDVKEGDCVVVTRPALQGEVYGAIYQFSRGSFAPLSAPAWLEEKTFAARVRRETKSGRYLNLMDEVPHPDAVARVAWSRFLKGKTGHFLYERTEPLYLQPSWAERKKC